MNRILIVLLSLVVLVFAACDDGSNNNQNNNENENVNAEENVNENESNNENNDNHNNADENNNDVNNTENDTNNNNNENNEENEAKENEERDEPEEEVSRKDVIIQFVNNKVEADYNTTSVRDIRVNEDLGTGEGYIVLVDLSFDAKNRPKTAKDMIDMYSSDLAATLGKEFDDINQTVVFWEVPYLQESGNIVKIATERAEGGMVFIEKWYDHNIFD